MKLKITIDGKEYDVEVEVAEEERTNSNDVKIIGSPLSATQLRALYFTRAIAPWGEGPLYHHVGLYAYRRSALERFVALKPSPLERAESLEQLRALENGVRIHVLVTKIGSPGIDTPEDAAAMEQTLAGAAQKVRR